MSSEYPPKAEMQRRGAESSDPARPSATAPAGRSLGAQRTVMSALVQRLARNLGRDPEELAAKIDPDTIRRTKYPVIEEKLPDGTSKFKHDPGIIEGRKASVRV